MEYVFGYGSLIWKPPPHAIERIPGYIKGFSRRFAQSSHDHRGTPESPGRVVTLVKADEWHSMPQADNLQDGDLVWGVCYRIDPKYAEEVKAYMDHREKDGYSCQSVNVWNLDHTSGREFIKVAGSEVYVGMSSNPSFIGPQKIDELAKIISTSVGPSGPNAEYLFELHKAVAELCPDSRDVYLDQLAAAVSNLLQAHEASS